MKELGPEARRLLDAAASLDAAPSHVQQRMRRRVLGTLAAGAVTSSALVAKGANLGSATTAAVASSGATAVGSSVSVGTGFFAAVALGLGIGTAALVTSHVLSHAPTSNAAHLSVVASQGKSSQATNPRADRFTSSRNRSADSEPLPSAEELANKQDSSSLSGLAMGQEPVNGPALSPVDVALNGANADLSHVNAASKGLNSSLKGRSVKVTLHRGIATGQGELVASQVGLRDGSREGTGDVIATEKPNTASIAEETAMLASVQRAMKSSNPNTALVVLDEYRAKFPAGALEEEATASRVVALCGVGRTQEGQRLSVDFFRRFPSSPLSGRVQAACSNQALASPPANH